MHNVKNGVGVKVVDAGKGTEGSTGMVGGTEGEDLGPSELGRVVVGSTGMRHGDRIARGVGRVKWC